jgi:hypothetical protein
MLSSNALRGVLSAIAAVSVSVPSALAGDGVPPRILLIDPAPGGGIVDQVGLANVTLTFSESIIPGAAPVAAWGVASGSIPVTTIYNPALNQLSVVLVPPAKTDRVTLYVLPSVTDVSGEPLDGEIAVPVAGFLPSGDGVAGGVAAFRYDILQGDVDGDGVTDAVDASLVLAALGACNGDAGFESSADLNADGCVNVFDVQIVLSGLGDALPALDGTPPVIGAISRADGAPLTADLEDLAITFSEPLESLSILPGLLEIRSIDGDVYVPATTSLSPDGLTVVAHFAPPLSSCGNYTVRVGNALADLSGELFLPPATAPSFAGSTPPPVPTLGAYPSATKSNGVTMSGTVPDAVGYADAESVRIQGPDLVVTAPVGAGGSFSTTVPLKQNVINYLYVSAISPCGVAGPPTVATVTQDTTGPNLTIQFPSSARIAKGQFFEDAINVGGTVGDTLSGFEGLTVTVNGQPAVVDIGLGQNGTWVRGNVPLNPAGVPTPIEVVATDILGNTSTASISVTKSAPPRNAAFLEALSGDDQSGTVDTTLRQPIRVQLWKADGTPFANKVVDFRVTQNDGRLSPADGGSGFGSGTMFFQTFTDASGVAAAMWTLGGTAGCGNNRVEVIAKDVAGVALFSATAFAAEPDQINIGSGNNQRVETGGVAPLPLSAWVSDSCNPVAGVPVTFTVTQGDGLVNGQTQVTVPSLPTGHADVTFTAGTTPGANRVEATYQGNETNPAVFTTYGIERDFTKPTSFHGLVLDNASRPIGNVGISLKFQDTIAASTFTSAQGQFEFPDLNKDGAVHVIVQGVFANKLNGQPLPAGVKFPSLGYEASIVPNAENTLGRPILLPPLLQTNAVVWNGQNDIELTCAGIEGLKFTVKAGSMTLENGSKPTVNAPVTLSLNQVHHDDIPMPMPNGVAPAFAWTFQPANATFDPPVTVEYPNMSVLPPGATAYFLTFNHDLGEFEIMAPGRVSEDGSVIVTEEGTGLSLSGWGCNCPPYAVTGDCCKCDSSAEGVTSLELADSDFQIWAPPLVWGPWVPVFSHGGPFQVTIEYEPQGDTTVFGEVRWQACKVSEDKCGTGGCEQKEVPFFGIWGGKTCDAWANVWVRFRGVPFGSVVDGSVSTSGSTCNPCGSQGAASADDAIGGFAGATWTVTGAGQSTTANPGGSFRLENLNAVDLFGPSGQGSPADGLSDDALRVVATGMTTGGSLTYAYSNLFKLPQGGRDPT